VLVTVVVIAEYAVGADSDVDIAKDSRCFVEYIRSFDFSKKPDDVCEAEMMDSKTHCYVLRIQDVRGRLCEAGNRHSGKRECKQATPGH
jgi:hypothetical protein